MIKSSAGNGFSAVENLVLEFAPQIRKTIASTLYSEIRDKEHIEDCFQNVMVIAYSKLVMLKNHENVRGWLVKTAKNVARKANQESISRKKRVELTEDLASGEWEEQAVEQWDSTRKIEQIRKDLSPRARAVFDLKWAEGLSDSEIALKLGLTLRAVKNRVYRIRRKIRETYPTDCG